MSDHHHAQKTEADHWDHTYSVALVPYLKDRLDPGIGREIYYAVCGKLRREHIDTSHAQDICSNIILNASSYLRRNRDIFIREPRAWLHTIRRHETLDYINKLVKSDAVTIDSVFCGKLEVSQLSLTDETRLLEITSIAVSHLSPRHREFIILDMGHRLPPEEIQRKMNIKSDGYFRKLKSEAFRALRTAITTIIENGVDYFS